MRRRYARSVRSRRWPPAPKALPSRREKTLFCRTAVRPLPGPDCRAETNTQSLSDLRAPQRAFRGRTGAVRVLGRTRRAGPPARGGPAALFLGQPAIFPAPLRAEPRGPAAFFRRRTPWFFHLYFCAAFRPQAPGSSPGSPGSKRPVTGTGLTAPPFPPALSCSPFPPETTAPARSGTAPPASGARESRPPCVPRYISHGRER